MHGGQRQGGVIQEGQWKLIEYFEEGRIELYDLENDPGETYNLRTEQQKLAVDMRGRLARWRAGVRAPMPQAQ